MQTLLAFKEVGFALVAIMLPIILGTLAMISYRNVADRKSILSRNGFYVGNHSHCDRKYDEAMLLVAGMNLLIRCSLLGLNILWFTIPFGRTHGWW